MNEKSIWENYLSKNKFSEVNENIKTDILVIGGGIAGVLSAYNLSKCGYKVVLVEKNKICSGNTRNTTAFVTAHHESLYQDIIKKHGFTVAKEYLKVNLESVKKYKDLSKKFNFDFKEVDATIFSKDVELINREYKILKKLDADVYINNDIPYVNNVIGVTLKNQAIINPIKLVYEIIKEKNNNLMIYENSEVVKIRGNSALFKNGFKIDFNYLVIATQYPILNKLNLMFMKLTQTRSYVVAIRKDKINGTYCSLDEKGYYFRSYGDYLIIGGNDRDTKNLCFSSFVEDVCKLYNIREKDIEYSWSGQDCITLDDIPYIGRFSLFHPNRYLITGFNLWGFTWSMASSKIIKELIEKNKIYNIAKPNRNFIRPKLFENICNSVKNFLTFKGPRCSHMGCRLQYNKIERVWECPCHGSRYTSFGEVIEGPARKKYKKEQIPIT